MGSIKSSFKFESYKIDTLQYEMKRNTSLLEFKGSIDPKLWQLTIKVRQPLYTRSTGKYIGAVDTTLSLVPPKPEEDLDEDSVEVNKDDWLIKVEVGIVGIFSVDENERFEKKIEEQLVKIQIPAILFPYVRSTITSLLSNAGFGSVLLPLINIHEMAKESLKDVDIQVIE